MQPISNIQYAPTHVYFGRRHSQLEGKFVPQSTHPNLKAPVNRCDQSCCDPVSGSENRTFG